MPPARQPWRVKVSRPALPGLDHQLVVIAPGDADVDVAQHDRAEGLLQRLVRGHMKLERAEPKRSPPKRRASTARSLFMIGPITWAWLAGLKAS
jgi:hypothetical protein